MLVHVSGANKNCPTCRGTGVKPMFGFGATCHCVDGVDNLIEHAIEMGRIDAESSMVSALNNLKKKKTQ